MGEPGPDPPHRPALDPRLVDALLALGITLAVGVVAAAEVPDAGPVRPTAYLFAVGFGALMFLRRRAPRTVLVLTVLGVFGYYALGYRPIGIALPAVAALYSAADMDRTRWAIGSGVVLLGVSAFFRIRQEDLSAAYLFSYDLVTNVALIAAAIALGITVRLRRDAHRQQQRLGDLMAAESAMRAAERLQAERMRIARDLHDAVGHSLSVVAVQSNVAAEALVVTTTGRPPEPSRRSATPRPPRSASCAPRFGCSARRCPRTNPPGRCSVWPAWTAWPRPPGTRASR